MSASTPPTESVSGADPSSEADPFAARSPADHLALAWTVFTVLLVEDWRLHTRLFGGWRFAIFPLVVAGIAAAGALALETSGIETGGIVLGVHLLVLGFGLYSGTAGFAGSDMLENLFGHLSLVLGTSGSLPLSKRYLLGIFLVKDALFYAVVFLLPVAASVGLVLDGFGPVSIAPLWLSLSIAFALGMSVTVGTIAGHTRGVPAALTLLGLAGAGAAGWVAGYDDLLVTLLVPLEASTAQAGALVAGIVLLGIGAIVGYDPTSSAPSRTASERFVAINDRLSFDEDGLVTKTLLDLVRSNGGVWKPLVSVTILFLLIAALVGVVESITEVAPAPGIFFGGVLGLSAFTTYNWLTQFDTVEEYLVYPVSIEDVFRAKRLAFVLVSAPTVALPYLVAVAWYDASALDAVTGAVVLACYALYYYGLTVYIAGFDPNEFLFDAVRFATFTLGVAVALVPTLVAGFVVVPPTPTIAAGVAALAILAGVVGVVLSGRAGPRWARRYRG